MTRAEKRNAIVATLNEDPSRSDRDIARQIGVSQVTVGAVRKNLNTVQKGVQVERVGVQIETEHPTSETEHPNGNVQIGQTETKHCPNDLDWLHDPAKRTPATVADWLLATFPHGIDRIFAAVQRRRAATGEASELEINWEAGKAARDLVKIWSIERLDQLRGEISKGAPTRMTDADRHAVWGSDKAPKSIYIPDDPASTAAKLWLYWGATPSKLTRLCDEIARRTNTPKLPPPPPEDPDIPF